MLKPFKQVISTLRSENRYREFLDISRICGEFPRAINNKNGRKIIVWCSNDYLGLGQNKDAIDAAKSALDTYGVGAGGTRNISGTNHPLILLEEKISKLHEKEAALSFTSGYVANDSTIQALAKIIPDLVIFSDEKNHASIIAGVRNSGLTKHIFHHNDVNHLEELLSKYDKNHPKIIIFESVYSMDGDFGKIKEIIALAKKYDALTYIDEVHSVGLYGATGAGLCEELGVANEIDIIQGTFAKAFGVIGGYIAARKEIIDAIRLVSSGFIFTTALAPSTAAAILANINHVKSCDLERKKMHENVKKIKAAFKKEGIKILENQSHIISVMIGDAKKSQEISKKLLDEFDIYIQHINYPTVARGDERLRITASPLHNDEMINQLIHALKICVK